MDRAALIKEMNRLKEIHARTGIIKLRDRIIEIQNELKESENDHRNQIETSK